MKGKKIKSVKFLTFMDRISIGQKSINRHFPGLVSVGFVHFLKTTPLLSITLYTYNINAHVLRMLSQQTICKAVCFQPHRHQRRSTVRQHFTAGAVSPRTTVSLSDSNKPAGRRHLSPGYEGRVINISSRPAAPDTVGYTTFLRYPAGNYNSDYMSK